VAVASQGSYLGGTGVTIYDSGVPRAQSSSVVGYGPLSFGSSSSTLYMLNSQTVYKLTIDSTGVTSASTLSTLSGYAYANSIFYDNGRLYVSNGQVLNSSTGALLGTLYSSANTAASGPVVSDSTLGRAFVGVTDYSSNGQLLAFDENTFNSLGGIPVNGIGASGYPTNFQKIVRWGQNGIALSAAASAYSTTNQIFIFKLPLVKDLSAAPADLSVTLTAPATATTGTNISWVGKISNNGPNQAQGAVLTMNLDSSLIVNSVTPSQGSCGTGPEFNCDLGNLASGASATVTVSATPSNAGTLAGVASVSSTTYDPTTTNDQATTSTVVSGGLYGALPSVSSISPNFVQAGSSDFTLTVTGAGFNAASTVNLGGTALPTSYVSATRLTATVTAAEIANYGWTYVSVANSAPGGGISQAQTLTVYAIVDVPASSLLFDPYSRLLYATIPSTATNMTGNSVVTIDPVTRSVGSPVFVGSGPTVMAETDDGNYLYVGLNGANSLAKFDLLHQSLAATIPLSVTGSTSGVAATWLAAMPGSDSTLAVNIANGWNNFGIFDISGNTGTFRPNLSGIYEGVNPVFADASHVYAYSGTEFYRYSVDTNGLTMIDGTTLVGLSGYSGSVQLANGLVYGGGGGIINPSTIPPSQVATLPSIDFYFSGILGSGVAATADPSLQKEFVMMENTAGTWAYGLARYNLNTYLPEALVNIPALASSSSANWTMLRFGQDGLALLSYAQNYATNQPVTVVILMRGPFVAPQLLTTNTAASLTSSSSDSITHGSGNMLLTLTGSNLLPGVAVTWNGSYRTTARANATQVTVAIPASDLVSGGTASLVATNPGATASNALQITIN
jgi:trimeric autotransporter adhesin